MSRSAPAAQMPVQANAENRYRITNADLPLSCPMPGMSLWNSHPKVYLPIVDQGGHARCPYCGALFDLEG
ncbi:MAG: zinc-finger domain-containing protein [Rhodanobacteraceae bacterium]